MQANNYITYDAAADYNAKFIHRDETGLDATNQGWCHRFAPFRAFICDPMVIQCLRYFRKTRCKDGYIDFDNNFLRQYFGDEWMNDEWCTACCSFITTLVQNTDRYGRLIEKRGYGCLKRTGNDLNTMGNLTSYTLNKEIYESVGNTLEYRYSTTIEEMCCFLSAVLSLLISQSVRYEADIENQHQSVKDKSFYEAENQYKFTRSPIIHYGNHFFNSCRINDQYTFAGYNNKEPYHYTHKDLVKKYINSFWPSDNATGKKIPEREPALTMFVPKITARRLGKETCDYSYAVPTQAGNQYQHNITNAKRKQWEIIRANETWDKGIKKLKFHKGRYAAAWQAFQKNWYSYNYFGALKAQQICNQAAIDFGDELRSLQTLTYLNPCLNNRVNQAFWIAPNSDWILK